MAFFYCLLLTLTVVTLSEQQLVYSPNVTTKTGRLQGHLVEVSNGNDDVYEFSGIPYAEPPTDSRIANRRFKKPTSKRAWSGVLLAVDIPKQCPQNEGSDLVDLFSQPVTSSEDCLFLNIYVPKKQLDAQGNRPKPSGLPVFFWIHGGGFLSGGVSLTIYNRTVMTAYENIIFVSVQYRLGAHGFAYLGTEDAPGNMGIWDQVEALKWVYQNIESFGGDPNRITIAGESAGAASVGTLLLSPYSRPYIHQAILHSASGLSPWASMTPAEAWTRTHKMFPIISQLSRPVRRCRGITNPVQLGRCVLQQKTTREACLNATDAVNGSMENKVTCLKAATASEYNSFQIFSVEVDRTVWSPGVMDLPWIPVIDGDLLPDDPRKMIASGNFTKVPLLLGSNKDEGSLFMYTSLLGLQTLPSAVRPNKKFDDLTHDTYRQMIDTYFTYYPINGAKSDELIRDAIELHYWLTPDDFNQVGVSGQKVIDQTIAMIGDVAISCPIVSWADAYSNITSVYQYFFTHLAANTPTMEWQGVPHAMELPFALGDALNQNSPFSKVDYTEEDRLIAQRMIQYWTNFVKFGNPNTVDTTLSNQLPLPLWPQYKAFVGDVLELHGDASKQLLIPSLKSRDCLFWSVELPEMYARLQSAPAQATTTKIPCTYNSANHHGASFAALLFTFAVTLVYYI